MMVGGRGTKGGALPLEVRGSGAAVVASDFHRGGSRMGQCKKRRSPVRRHQLGSRVRDMREADLQLFEPSPPGPR